MGNPATGQQLNHFRSDARGAIDRSQTELKLAFWNVFKTIRRATIGCRRQAHRSRTVRLAVGSAQPIWSAQLFAQSGHGGNWQ
ncbi:hypothetical protein A1507_15575 [Methylomonas koyamae]|uniref:Uncharacterized protein n=1 Tax=Methylomonas koyamae TaxID=702114 RepID=A0A177N8A7_9GAMM|nr:hypothetical protein A1507_15575 [Methylomonas koyamae]